MSQADPATAVQAGPIRLVLADVDGTLVTADKVLTERARRSVLRLREKGIAFAITSGRPPRGMGMLIDPLQLDSPIAGFNGGIFARPDLTIIEERTLDPDIAKRAVALIQGLGLDVWLYVGNDWLIRDPKAAHVDQEAATVKFSATIVGDFDDRLSKVAKIVGISDDLELVKRAEAAAQKEFGDRASAARSQPYYLDVTHPQANKGAVVDYLSRYFKIDRQAIATIGDMPNDVLMFKKSGYSIAMGNASDEVKKQASFVTDSFADEGFAKAIEHYVLGDTVSDMKAVGG